MSSERPIGNFRFKIEIDGVVVGHFQGVSGISSEHEVVTHVEGGRNDRGIKLPGQGQFGSITLKRGYASEATLRNWIADVSTAGKPLRRSLSVIVLGDDAYDEVGRYDVIEAWPNKWEIEELQGESLEAVETLELAHHGLQWKPVAVRRGAGSDVARRAAAAARAARAARRVREIAQAAADAAGAVGGVARAVASAADAAASAIDRAADIAADTVAAAGAAAGPHAAEGAWAAAADAAFDPTPGANVEDAMAGATAASVAGAATPPAAAPADARRFSRGGGSATAGSNAEGGAAPGGAWSDGVDRSQSVAGFGEPGLPAGFGG